MKTAEISRSHDSRLQPTISTPRLIGEGSLVFWCELKILRRGKYISSACNTAVRGDGSDWTACPCSGWRNLGKSQTFCTIFLHPIKGGGELLVFDWKTGLVNYNLTGGWKALEAKGLCPLLRKAFYIISNYGQ